MAAQAASFDLSTAFLDQPKTLAYGLVRGAGNLILQQELTDKTRVSFYMLGEGPWDSILRLWINSKQVTLPSSSTVHFHPGLDGEIGNGLSPVSTGGDQHVDQFFTLIPGGLDPITFSRYAWLALKTAPDPGAPSAQLTVLADYQAMQLRQFDSSGNQTAFAWTQNWAWIICDFLIRKFVLREGKVNQPLVAAELARFDWPSFSAAATYYDAVLSLGQKRFSDGGVVYVNSSDTADKALEQMLMMCRSYLLERNGKLSLYADQPRSSIFTFTSDNVVAKTFKAYKTNLRAATNRLTPTFRDLNLASGSSDDATRFAIASDPQLNNEAHQRAVGARGAGLSVLPKITELVLDLGVNTPERVWRILDALLVRQLGDDVDANSVYNAPFAAEWTGFEDSLAIEPGDVVTIDPSLSEEFGGKLFEVLEPTYAPDGTIDYVALEYMPNAFPDVAPTQQALEAPTPGSGLPLSTSSSTLANPDLEAGDRDWTEETGFSIVNDPANAYGGGWCAKFVGTAAASFRNSVKIAVQQGDVILATAMVKRTAGDGIALVRISWMDSSFTEFATSIGNAITSSSYGTSRVSAVAPSGAFWGRVEGEVTGMSVSTTAFFDQFTASIVPKSLDEVPDGSSYARPIATDMTSNRLDFSKALLNKQLDNIPDGSTYARPLSARISSGKPLIDFSEAIHLNKNLDNVGDGSTYARPLATALASGAVKAAHISNQATGQRTVGATLCQGSPGTNLTFGGWKNVATCTINIPPGTASIKLHVFEPTQISGVGSGFTGVGFAIYASLDPGAPQVSHTNVGGVGFNGDLTLSSPTTGTGLTLALYVQGSGTNDSLNTTPLSVLSQNVVQILDSGVLT